MIRIAAALAALSLAVAARAEAPKTQEASSTIQKLPEHASPSGKSKLPPLKAPADVVPQDKNLRIAFKIRCRELEANGNFVVESGTQANYVRGGDLPWETGNAQGKGIEFKKTGVIVNALPFIKPETEDTVDSQMQIELSGPIPAKNALNVPEIATFQLQTEFSVTLGKTVVLVDEPDRHVEITITEAK